MAIKVKLTKSFAGASEDMLATIRGLGLKKFGEERLLKDTPANRGMVFKVKHLVSLEKVSQEAPAPKRRKARKIVARDRARARNEAQAKA
ncbi:50S ribosomal protein L30 [Corallococcus sp. H22C18031201]|uniref:50S ribosomal protein L30 n=1 Tax=Citreicoccus inhibens TaxID=2849499 RepID=UPI000E73238C|nr:50S ribosomal protein L30 [Citreicoccus inhibens]MBU8897363.1 50S ribosomal protein L30 [Citreicoccus inhibens]RJS16851.1 50S ribosomal protein L30 [Corallococcus sp. H22C18031201]